MKVQMKIRRLQKKETAIGDYQIIEIIETGSLGDQVYLCRRDDSSKLFSLRLLPEEVLDDDDFTERFLRAARLSSQLKHPNILSAIDVGEFEEKPFFVTEYFNSKSLKVYSAEHGVLSERELKKLFTPLIEALKYAWDIQKLIHRNITPDSILVVSSSYAMLEDFGLAKSADASNPMDNYDLTMVDVTIGHAEYMSPEQARGIKDLDCRSDIYCMGVVLYEMLTRQHPFGKGLTQMQMMLAHVGQEPPSILSLVPHLSKNIVSVIERMLAKDPDRRYPDWDAVLQEFNPHANSVTAEFSQQSEDKSKKAYKGFSKEEIAAIKTNASLHEQMIELFQDNYYPHLISGIGILTALLLSNLINSLFIMIAIIIGIDLCQAVFSKVWGMQKLINLLKN